MLPTTQAVPKGIPLHYTANSAKPAKTPAKRWQKMPPKHPPKIPSKHLQGTLGKQLLGRSKQLQALCRNGGVVGFIILEIGVYHEYIKVKEIYRAFKTKEKGIVLMGLHQKLRTSEGRWWRLE